MVYFLERFRDGDVSDEGYRAFLVDTFLNSVYLYDDDKLVLVLNYTGERCKVTLDLVESAVESDGLGGSCFAPSSAPKKRRAPRVPAFFIKFFLKLRVMCSEYATFSVKENFIEDFIPYLSIRRSFHDRGK